MKTIASASLPSHVQQPRYDRQQLRSRIVHLGFGAFHRAHQALLTNRVLNAKGGDWGICEISLFSGDVLMSQLRAQNHLFTVLEKGAEVIVLTDSSKFEAIHPYTLGPLERFSRVVTDSRLSASVQMQLEHSGLTVNIIDAHA